MRLAEVLTEGFGRIHEEVHGAVEGLTGEQVAWRPDQESNSIAWLVWHLTRIQDDHIADAAGEAQLWTSGWSERFALPFADSETGYAQDSKDVAQVQPKSPELLTDYYDAVHERTLRYLSELTEVDLDRIVDDSWDPPVTLGVRLISVLSDDLQHAGQAAFLRGLVLRQSD